MEQNEVVYKTHPANVARSLRVLRKHELHPIALDDPDSTARYVAKEQYLVRIAVPSSERARAAAVLLEVDTAEGKTVDELARAFRKGLAGPLLLYFAVLLGFYLYFGQLDSDSFGLSFLITMLLSIAWQMVRRRRTGDREG